MLDRVPFGAFDLDHPIAHGAQGEVWRGTHVASGQTVAVKLVSAANAWNASARASFEDEIRRTARLDHPHIAMVLESGMVGEATERASEGRIRAGAAFLVMEYASGGSLQRFVQEGLRWSVIERVVDAILDALAHAHARGVLHRDLKPSNLLLAGPDDPCPGVKLTDFGVASALSEQSRKRACVGTPIYMPPELWLGEMDRQGPWSDLYSLGCVTYEFLTGEPPFAGIDDFLELRRAHLEVPAPRVPRAKGVPPGVAAWVARLLAKDPRDRFSCAADARLALRRAIAAGPYAAPGSLPPGHASLTTTFTGSITGDPVVGGPSGARPADPLDWRGVASPGRTLRVAGVGLGLYGLRPLPLVGRETEADHVWSRLEDVTATGQPAAVCVRGTAGVGKSHVVDHLAERAAERGLAQGIDVVGVTDGPAGGSGLFLRPRGHRHDLAPEVAATSVAELISRLRLLAGERPVLLVIDDAQRLGEGLGLVQRLVQQPGPLPVLALLVVEEEGLATRPVERAALEALRVHPRVSECALEPLPPEAADILVREHLGLEGALAAEVCTRAAGNPMYAVQLVTDLVRRDVLLSARGGYRLRPGARLELPADLATVWSSRVRAVLGDLTANDTLALGAAAVLGVEVERAEWRGVCERLDVEAREALLGLLVDAGLATRTAHGIRLAHEMARAAMEREASISVSALHSADAAVLAERPPSIELHTRLAGHFLALGDTERACHSLRDAAEGALRVSRLIEARSLVESLDRLAGSLDPVTGDRVRVDAWCLRARIQLFQGDPDEAERFAARAAAVARRHGWKSLATGATIVRGLVAEKRGDLSLAETCFREGVAGLRDDDGASAECLEHLGTIHRMRGELESAMDFLDEAAKRRLAAGDQRGHANVLKESAGVQLRAGATERASALLHQAVSEYAAAGDPGGTADALNNLGDVLRAQGDLDGAEQAYGRSATLLRRVGATRYHIPLANGAIVTLLRGHPAEAEPPLREAIEVARRERRRVILPACLAALLSCLASAGDELGFDRCVEEIDSLLLETGLVDSEIADLLRVACSHLQPTDTERRAAVERLVLTQESGPS